MNAVIIINSRGQMQMANRLAYTLFGYNKGELEGKNVAILMPQPFRCDALRGLAMSWRGVRG